MIDAYHLRESNRLANICDLNYFIQFLRITADLTGKRLAGIITTVLMERRWPPCERTRISQNEKHEHEYQDYIERMTLNLFQLQFQLAAFIITFEGVHQNLWPLPIQRKHKKLVAHRHISYSCNISWENHSCLGKEKTSSLVEAKLGKLRWMATGFCPVSIFALSFLSSFCISINCFSARCYLTVLLACGGAMCSSLGRPSAHLLTQFVWHYCPSLGAMGSWQTRECMMCRRAH